MKRFKTFNHLMLAYYTMLSLSLIHALPIMVSFFFSRKINSIEISELNQNRLGVLTLCIFFWLMALVILYVQKRKKDQYIEIGDDYICYVSAKKSISVKLSNIIDIDFRRIRIVTSDRDMHVPLVNIERNFEFLQCIKDKVGMQLPDKTIKMINRNLKYFLYINNYYNVLKYVVIYYVLYGFLIYILPKILGPNFDETSDDGIFMILSTMIFWLVAEIIRAIRVIRKISLEHSVCGKPDLKDFFVIYTASVIGWIVLNISRVLLQ